MRTKFLSLIMAMTASGAVGQSSLGSGIDRNNMNLSVRPGTDFFEYAAGGWMKAHPLTPEYSRYAQFDRLQETNREQLRRLIEDIAASTHEHGSLQQKIGTLYNLAMDSVRRNAEGWKPLEETLGRIDAINDISSYQMLAAQLSRRGVQSMIAIYCGADLKNSKTNLLQIEQSGLSMSERDYYLADDEPTRKIRTAYQQYVRKLFAMTGYTEPQAEQAMQAVLAIETRIAAASLSATELRDVERNYNKMSYADLLTRFPGIDWSTCLLFAGIPAVSQVSVNQPEPVHEVEKILSETPIEDLKAYLRFKVIDDATGTLSDDFRAVAFDFYSHTMSGAEQDRPRWKRAVGAVEGTLGMAVGRMYVEKYFPEASKQRMLRLVSNLQTALSQRIDAQQWMTDETKRQAQEKLNSFYVKIGYPDTWMDYAALDIDDSHSFYHNMAQAAEFIHDYHINKRVNKPVDRDEWLMTPQTINAYYNPTTNEICFPAGILQPPFFNPEADDACNYGAIGVVIGHEMTHGFDDQGSQFDKDGNLRNWWTEADANNFRSRTKVMEQFFNNIQVLPGLHANGKLTLGENIADHGGINVAFQALRNAMQTSPLPVKDNFTPEQRFFLSYGLIWGNNIREEMLRQLNKIDPHSPGRWRVNGALPHIDAWYDAFRITKSDPLYLPKKSRVNVW